MTLEPPGAFEATVSQRGGQPLVMVTLRGPITFALIPRMARLVELARQRQATVMELSLEHVTFIDSAGIGLLMAVRSALLAGGGALLLVGVSDRARRNLQRNGVADMLMPAQTAVA